MRLAICVFILIVCGFSSFASDDSQFRNFSELIEGNAYTQGEYLGRSLMLTSLISSFSLEKRNENSPSKDIGVSLPYEEQTRIFLVQDDAVVDEIEDLDQLTEHVTIKTPYQAVEFVRLRTSLQTYFLFRPNLMIELFVAPSDLISPPTTYGMCSPEIADQYGIRNLTIVSTEEGFLVERYVLKFAWPSLTKSGNPIERGVIYKRHERVVAKGGYWVTETLVNDRIEKKQIAFPGRPR